MKSKISNGLLIIFNIFRLPIMYIINLGKVQCFFIQLLSLKSNIKILKKGKITIGRMCRVEPGSLIKANGGIIKIGDNVFINRNCNIISHENITINDGVTIGPNVSIYDHDHDFKGNKNYISKKIYIDKNVWIGANVIILKGVSIGEGSVIGAGSVITKDIKPKTIVTMKNDLILRGIYE